MPATSDWQPRTVEHVDTKYRKIVTPIPVPDSIPILERLKRFEPEAMRGQPPVVWDRAEGISVFDRWGNQWLDWSSGVLITNAGHGRHEIVDAIVSQARKPLLTTYCFPNEIRAELVEKLVSMSPAPLRKAFLLTTGSETSVIKTFPRTLSFGPVKFMPLSKVFALSADRSAFAWVTTFPTRKPR